MSEEDYLFLHSYMQSHINRGDPEPSANAAKYADGTLVPVAEEGKLFCEPELRFMHFRHWSLYDAMCETVTTFNSTQYRVFLPPTDPHFLFMHWTNSGIFLHM